MCGVTLDRFAILLYMLPAPADLTCDIILYNRLLIFLMKLKSGISYSALAVLFSISRSTVTRHFKSVLSTLCCATKKWIYRPSTYVIRPTMPDCFKVHYPNCAMIIDCTEVMTEQPYRVQQQRALYSNYKDNYTVKFLVGKTPSGFICL